MNWKLICALAIATYATTVQGCTAFQLKAQDGSEVYCRSMEFGFKLNSNLLIAPQRTDYVGTAGTGAGLKWKSRYGFVGMNQSLDPTVVSDGMNEKGLVVSLLYLPGFAQFEPLDPERTDETLGAWELPAYLLSTCQNAEEVRAVMPHLLVAQQPVPGLKDFILPVHVYVKDAKGTALVIEYVNGERKIYDNPVGALTNSPPFDFQLNNLANYVNLSPYNAPTLDLSNWKVQNFGQGSGLIGLPGDYTPPSRFVRATLFSHWADQPKTALDAVRTGFHILNTFDIFSGIVISSTKAAVNPQKAPPQESTEWVIVHDQTNLRTYFRTYEGLNIQMISFEELNFKGKGLKQIPLADQFTVENVGKKAVPMR